MVANLLEYVSGFIVQVIEYGDYWGIVLLMGIESACIPLPSELIMPFAGFLVGQGKMDLWMAALAGGVGCVWGSAVAYAVGYFGGRPLIEKFGKYVLITSRDLDWADKWSAKYGVSAAFFSRLLPVIRTFISLPLGIARVNFWLFILYTFIGSVIWSLLLGYLGMVLGQNWQMLKVYFHEFDLVIGVILLAGVIYYIWRHLKK